MIEVSRDGGVAIVLLNRPERRNALDIAMMRDLARHLAELALEEELRALVLSGAGNVFCSGLDLGRMEESPAEPTLERILVDDVLKPLEAFPRPTIAALNGDGYAGGCELALHCDIRIAVPTVRLGMPVARLGIVVPYPLILKLIDIVGPAVTSELLFTGEPLDAARAHALGMINRLTSPENLMDEATKVARTIASNAPLAVAAMKMAIRSGRTQRAFEAPAETARAAEKARTSEDVKEGLRAILEKRKPAFRGR